MLRPRERAILSIVSNDFFSGNRAAMRAYPGKKIMKGIPINIRAGKSGIRYMNNANNRDNRPIRARSQERLIPGPISLCKMIGDCLSVFIVYRSVYVGYDSYRTHIS